MQRKLVIFAVALLMLMSGALFYAAKAPIETAEPSAAVAPGDEPGAAAGRVAFSLNDMDGVKRDFSEYAGRHSLLNFWATWCAPCRREIPLLKAFHARQDQHGVQVLGLAFDVAAEVSVYAEAAAFNYPVLVGEQDVMAVAETSGVEVVGLPFTMIVHRDGELLSAHMGEIHQQQLDAIADVFVALDANAIDRDTARARLSSL